MSDSNVGARKNQNIRNHLFILYAVINSVLKTKDKCIDIQIYDLVKAFDNLWLEDSMIDLVDSTEESNQNDKLALVYKASEANLIAVKTPMGLTERVNMPLITLQGGTWGPMGCSNSIDKIGKESEKNSSMCYYYKGIAKILPMAMVDDLLSVSDCGTQSVVINSFINTKIEMKKLTFHTQNKEGMSKCQKMHIGNPNSNCPVLSWKRNNNCHTTSLFRGYSVK